MAKYLLMGAGNQSFAMASHIIKNGDEVNIWNIDEELIKKIKATKTINCSGVINGEFKINMASTDIDEVMCDIIFITTPAVAHKFFAKLLAPRVNDKTTIIISPGRTFGIIEFIEELKLNGCTSLPKIAELQTIIYTCRKTDNESVEIYALKEDILISTVNENLDNILNAIPNCITAKLKRADSFIQTSLGNVGMILHCAPVLMNIGWIESDNDFKYYTEGISKTVANFLEKLDNERILIASKLGYSIESVTDWMKRVYNCEGKNLYEVIQNNKHYEKILAPKSIQYRYLEEDIPFGLVPLETIAKELNIDAKITTLIIDLANVIMNKDYRVNGRKITNVASYL